LNQTLSKRAPNDNLAISAREGDDIGMFEDSLFIAGSSKLDTFSLGTNPFWLTLLILLAFLVFCLFTVMMIVYNRHKDFQNPHPQQQRYCGVPNPSVEESVEVELKSSSYYPSLVLIPWFISHPNTDSLLVNPTGFTIFTSGRGG